MYMAFIASGKRLHSPLSSTFSRRYAAMATAQHTVSTRVDDGRIDFSPVLRITAMSGKPRNQVHSAVCTIKHSCILRLLF